MPESQLLEKRLLRNKNMVYINTIFTSGNMMLTIRFINSDLVSENMAFYVHA